LHVLENHQHCLPAGKTLKLPNQTCESILTLAPRIGWERRVPTIAWQRQQIGDQGGRVRRVLAGSREEQLKLVELGSQGIFTSEAGGRFDLCNDRMERAVGVVWRAEIT